MKPSDHWRNRRGLEYLSPGSKRNSINSWQRFKLVCSDVIIAAVSLETAPPTWRETEWGEQQRAVMKNTEDALNQQLQDERSSLKILQERRQYMRLDERESFAVMQVFSRLRKQCSTRMHRRHQYVSLPSIKKVVWQALLAVRLSLPQAR